jgi:LemA protein
MGKSVALGCIVLILVGVLVVGGMAAGAYNKLNAADQAVSGAWAQVENVYQRRADLIPNLVETVKGAANFEKETLTQVIQARASATQVKLDANSIKDPAAFEKFQKAQDGLGSAIGRLLVSVEKYPELKANQNFRDLQSQLEGTENRINVARVRYNKAVQEFNTSIRIFPNSMTNSLLLHLQRKEPFKADEGAKASPKVKF